MASETVLKYLQDTNRPYSCEDVTVNLRGAYTKTVIQKTLDALCEAGKVKCKMFGKQKVYVAVQYEDVGNDNDVEDYETQLKILEQNVLEKKNNFKEADLKLKTLLSTPTTEAANIQVEEKQRNNDRLKKQLESLRCSTDVISADVKKSIMDERNKLLKEYRKRKRIGMDMIEAVIEDQTKSKKDFLEELGIETDEMVEFKLMSE